MLVAREGERATPPRMAPQPLRRYLNFARLPDPALEVARRVLDEDAEFRGQVEAAVDEERIGHAGWLFLTRPEGWQAEVEALVQKASAAELAAKEDRAERAAQRRLAGAEAAASRAEAAASAALAEAHKARLELDAERADTAPLREAVAQMRTELEELRANRATTIARLKQAEATLAARNAELRALRHELRMTQAELAQGGGAGLGADLPDDSDRDPNIVDAASTAAADVAAAAAARAEAVAAAVARAADAAAILTRALADAGSVLAGEPLAVSTGPDAPDEQSRARRDRVPSARRPRSRRRPAALPPGVLEDAAEAAEHLVRVPGALVLVDGYNISHAQWWGHPPAEQRARLLDACAELHARFGTEIEVVFDGDQPEETAGSLARSGVRYRFTAAGVEADDVLLARVDEEPLDRPVVVVSSDRRVRDGAQRRGANVLGARQILAVLRR
jgi:predicted RNA-binding protein with PIN domain